MQKTTMAERQAFSQRLHNALKRHHVSPDSPTQLAREFNLRHGGDPISTHAARKWLTGETIPTQDKMRTLADWLGLTAQWLRYGDDNDGLGTGQAPITHGRLTARDAHLIDELLQLDEESRTLIHALIRLISKQRKA